MKKLILFLILSSSGLFGQATTAPSTTNAVPYYSDPGTVKGVAGPTSPNGVPQVLTSTPSGGIAGVPTWVPAGNIFSSLQVSPSTLTYPGTISGSTSSPQNVTITNTGLAAVALTSISNATSNFTTSLGANCTGSLASEASCVVSVTFTPTTTGMLTDTLSIVSATGTQTVPLNGTGLSASYPTTSSIAVSPATPTVLIGNNLQMTAIDTFSDSSTQAWASKAWWALTAQSGGAGTPTVALSCTPSYASSQNLTCSIGSVTSGYMLGCIAVTNATTNTYTVSDTLGTTFTGTSTRTSGSGSGGNNGMIQGFYGTLTSSGNDTITITESPGSQIQVAGCVELSNVSAFDVYSSANTSSSATISSGNFTTTANGDAAYCAFDDPATSGPYTVGSGFTVVGTQNGYSFGSEFKVLGSAGTFSGTMTNSSSTSTSQGACLAFKPTSGVVATITNPGGIVTAQSAGTATISAAAGYFAQSGFTPNQAVSTTSTAFAQVQTGGDLNAVFITWLPTSGSCTALAASPVTDTAGNSYSAAGSVTSGNGLCGVMYYSNDIKPVSGQPSNITNVNVTWSAPVTGAYVLPMEFSGLLGSSVVDVYAGNTGAGTSGTNAITTTNATDLIASVCYTSGTELGNSGTAAGGNSSDSGFYTVLFATGSYTPTCTLGTAGTPWLMLTAAFKTPVGTSAFTASASTTQTPYYVNVNTGSDSNNGTSPSTPWKTINHALTTYTLGAHGSIIHVAAGTYTEADAGACHTDIAIPAAECIAKGGSSSTVRLTLQCDVPYSIPPGSGCLIRPTNTIEAAFLNDTSQNYYDIVGFDISGAYLNYAVDAFCATGSPPTCTGGNSVHVLGNYIHDMGALAPANLNTTYNTAGCVQNGAVGGSNHGYIVSDFQAISNRIENVFQKLGPGFNCGHGIYISSADGVLIWNNIIINPAAVGIEYYDSACRAAISNNTVIGAGQSGIQVASGPNNVCTNTGDNTVTNNIVWGSESANYSATSGTNSDCTSGHPSYWYSNLSYQPGSTDTAGFATCDQIGNFYTGTNPQFTSVTFSGNTATEFGNYTPAAGSPLLTNTYPYRGDTSTCATGATIVPCIPVVDFNGTTRQVPPIIGAIE
jgi:hypothetical protein